MGCLRKIQERFRERVFETLKMQEYDEEADVLNIELDDKEYWKSIELPKGIIVDIARDGTITSIEILNASKLFFGDAKKVIEMVSLVSAE